MEQLLEQRGNWWVWLSFDPVHKVVSAFVAGKISQENADLLLQKTEAVNDGSLHIFLSDQRRHYKEAILKSFLGTGCNQNVKELVDRSHG